MKIFHKIKEEKPESRENILDFDSLIVYNLQVKIYAG